MKTRERRSKQEEDEEPAGGSGMVTRNGFGSFRRRLNGQCQANNERHGVKIVTCNQLKKFSCKTEKYSVTTIKSR